MSEPSPRDIAAVVAAAVTATLVQLIGADGIIRVTDLTAVAIAIGNNAAQVLCADES